VLLTSSDNRIEGNHFEANEIGVQAFTAGNFIARNTCAGNDMNWSVVSGNVCFVVNAVTSGTVGGDSGGVSPGTTSPWANFTF
jgi:nitrous oxidase accessory protein NosD